jgi:hypothetical protein
LEVPLGNSFFGSTRNGGCTPSSQADLVSFHPEITNEAIIIWAGILSLNHPGFRLSPE